MPRKTLAGGGYFSTKSPPQPECKYDFFSSADKSSLLLFALGLAGCNPSLTLNRQQTPYAFLSELPGMKQLDEWLRGSLPFSFLLSPGCRSAARRSEAPLLALKRERGPGPCEETLQVAALWQVSIDVIDFKLKRGCGVINHTSPTWTPLQFDALASPARTSRRS